MQAYKCISVTSIALITLYGRLQKNETTATNFLSYYETRRLLG